MRRRLATVVAAGVFAAGLAGCGPGDDPTPSPAPATMDTTPAPSPTPTSQWTAEQQAAIDAVDSYLALWATIGQRLDTASDADLARIFTVANDTVGLLQINKYWHPWQEQHLHLVGAPSFEPATATAGDQDDAGQQYQLTGCYSTEGSYLADVKGNPMPNSGGLRNPVEYVVLRQTDSSYLVTSSTVEMASTC